MVEGNPILLTCCVMRAPSRVRYHSRTPCIITSVVLVATLVARTGPATIPTPPSSADKWLYPALNTDPTYNYLDTVNASWTSNFVDPYLLLRCQHPNDTVDYAYRKSFLPVAETPSRSNVTAQHTTSLCQQQAQPSFPWMMEAPGCATSKCPTSVPPAPLHPHSIATTSTSC